MYHYLEPIIGIPVSNLVKPSPLLEEFYKVVIEKYDAATKSDWNQFDEHFQSMLDDSSPLLKEFLTFISLNRNHLDIYTFYSGSHNEYPCCIKFKTHVSLGLEPLESSTWDLLKLLAIQTEVKNIRTNIVSTQMSHELYNTIDPFFGLSFIAATS